MERIPIAGPWITEREVAYVADAVANAWYGNAGIYHDRFEKSFSEYVGTAYAVALPSCTSAIHLSLLALGVGRGDEVIVPDVTWIASAAPIQYVGAETVFADVDPLTWCLSAKSFRQCITPRTRAVLPVDLYGGMPDMDAICAVAREHDVAVIEDAAEAIGSQYKDRNAGSFGDTGVFSFHGSKTLTTGEGGMLVTDRKNIYDRVLFLRDHGRVPGDRLFRNTEVGYKYKMSSMQAALGLAQLERMDELVARKREIFSWYQEELDGLKGVKLNHEPAGTTNSYWMVTLQVDPSIDMPKERLMQMLDAENIDSRPFFHPLSSLPAYSSHPQAALARQRNGVSYTVSKQACNLPSALNLTPEQVRYVCQAIRKALRQ